MSMDIWAKFDQMVDAEGLKEGCESKLLRIKENLKRSQRDIMKWQLKKSS